MGSDFVIIGLGRAEFQMPHTILVLNHEMLKIGMPNFNILWFNTCGSHNIFILSGF